MVNRVRVLAAAAVLLGVVAGCGGSGPSMSGAGSAETTLEPEQTVVSLQPLPASTEPPLPTSMDFAQVQSVLPQLDLRPLAASGSSVRDGSISVAAGPGLSKEESPVGNELCMVLSVESSETGRVCANSGDVGGLLAFTHDLDGRTAAITLTADSIDVDIPACAVPLRTSVGDGVAVTLCAELDNGVAAVELVFTGSERGAISLLLPLS